MATDNSIGNDINGLLAFSKSLIAKLQSGEGLNLTDEQKEEYKKKYADSELEKGVEKLKAEMQKFKDNISKINGAGN